MSYSEPWTVCNLLRFYAAICSPEVPNNNSASLCHVGFSDSTEQAQETREDSMAVGSETKYVGERRCRGYRQT